VTRLGLALSAVALLAGGAKGAPAANGLIAYAVFENASEIRVVAPDGSGRRPLMPGTTPAWSPDGTRLAFVDGGKIAVVAADGSGRRTLTDGRSPAWSPDGSRIAFSNFAARAFGDSDLFVLDLGSGAVTPLTSGPARDDRPAWSPDGASIAFERDGAIWVMSSDGRNPRVLLGRGGGERTPAWTPDGSRLAFEREGVVYSVSSDGTGSEQRLSPFGLWSTGPSWSPDGTRVAFFAGGAVCTARTDGTDARRVTFDNRGVTTYDSGGTAVSWQPAARAPAGDSPHSCADPRWDLELTISANRSRATVGGVVTYRAVERNLGPDPATQTSFGIQLPEESERIATRIDRGTCEDLAGGTYTSFVDCNPGLLLPGESAQITISVRLLAPGPLRATVQAPVWGEPHDVNGENDSARVTVVVAGCTITGTYGADVLRGTPGRDVICGLDGADVVRGLGGDDQVWAGPGNDLVEGGPGRDRLLGGSGRDSLDAGPGPDVVWAGYDRDVVLGGAGDDALHGGERGGRALGGVPHWEEADRVSGGPGDDLVDGGVGADQLRGDDGDDVVQAADNGEADVVDCGRGRDRLVRDTRDRQRRCERVSPG
jgi:uncharacterized repeat protein (TIGR01451 family)